MKRKLLLLVSSILLATSFCNAETTLSAEHQQLRTEIKQFITDEGYAPSIDSDGDIMFKFEGKTYYVKIYKDTNPFFIAIYRYHTYSETFTKEKILNAIAECNFKKGVKVVAYEESYNYRAEMFINSVEPLKGVFTQLLDQIKSISSALADMM